MAGSSVETGGGTLARFAVVGRALRHRNYRLFVVGQGISLIGTWMQQTALAWLVYQMTGSSLLLGVVSFAVQIPTFFLAPVAGVLSDYFSRRRTLVLTQSVAMVQSILLVLLVWSGQLTIWQIIALSVLLGFANAFDMPTRQAFLIDMIDDRGDLPNAIALNSSMVNATRLVGPFAAGVLLATAGALVCFLFNAVSFLAVIVAYLSMRNLPQRPRPERLNLSSGLNEGFRYAFGFAPIRALLVMMAMASVLGMPITVLLPAFASDVLGGGPRLYGLLTGCMGIGALSSGLYMASLTTVLGLGRKIVWAATVLGLSLLCFGWSQHVALSFVMLVVIGFALMLQMASCNTLIQTIVEEDKRGRVMSFYTMAFMGSAPLGSLITGAVADHLGPPVALTINGSLCLVGAVAFGNSLPWLREQVVPIYRRIGVLPEVAVGIGTTTELTTAPEEAG